MQPTPYLFSFLAPHPDRLASIETSRCPPSVITGAKEFPFFLLTFEKLRIILLHNDAMAQYKGDMMPRGMGGPMRMMGAMMDPRSRFFMALSSDQRLRIIEMLKGGEKTLSDFTKELEIDISVVSRHLMMLRGLGIVSARREGVSVYFNIADKRIFDVIAMSNQIISDWFKQNQQMFQ